MYSATRKQGRSILQIALVTFTLLAAGCQQAAAPSPTPPAASETSMPSPTPTLITSPLVGEWVGVHNCQAIVEALSSAGFDASVVLDNVIGNGLVPGADSYEDLADQSMPCADAIPREHGHFFTAAGEFGSRDWDGNQVDEGLYEIVDDDTLLINGVEFGYSIEGDELKLESIPEGCVEDECIWSIMVSMPGESMHRVD